MQNLISNIIVECCFVRENYYIISSINNKSLIEMKHAVVKILACTFGRAGLYVEISIIVLIVQAFLNEGLN